MLDARRLRRASSSLTSDLDAAIDGADVRALPDPRRRAGRRGCSDETVPLRCGCIGQETTGAGGFAKAMRTVPVVLELAERVARARGAGRLDRRLHEPGRDRHARAARRGPPRGRAVQRRDHVPAPARAAARASSRSACIVDQVGLNHLTWIRARAARRRATSCPSCSRGTATSSRPRSSCRAACSTTSGVLPSYYLHYFYAHDRVLAEQQDGVPRAQTVAEIERELLEHVPRPER